MPELLDRSTTSASHRSPPPPALLEELLVADERLARTELRRQIGRLEAELASIFASAFPRKQIEWGVAPAGGPRVLGIGEAQCAQRVLKRINENFYVVRTEGVILLKK